MTHDILEVCHSGSVPLFVVTHLWKHIGLAILVCGTVQRFTAIFVLCEPIELLTLCMFWTGE